MSRTKSTPKAVKDPLTIVDAIFATKARQKMVAGATGFLGISLIGMSALIASIKPEDIYPAGKIL